VARKPGHSCSDCHWRLVAVDRACLVDGPLVNPEEARPWQLLPLVTLVGVAGFLLLLKGSEMQTPLGSYAGFFGALLVWAWHETTFLTGMVTGRSKQECPPDAKGAARFVAAWKAVCDHEIALLVTAVFLWFVLADAPNTFGLATFGLLWGMRISAKLLIFLGARHAISGLMPPGIVHLKTYFQHWTDNPLFPASSGDRGWVVCGPGGWSDECAQRVLRRRSHFARRVYGTGNHRTPNSRSAGLGHGALALGGSQGARDPRSNPPGHEFAPAGVGTKRGLETR
jgi:hypothetical protein